MKKVHISVTFLLITFFWYIFSKLFQRIRNQREILRFLTPFPIFFKKYFLMSYVVVVPVPYCTVHLFIWTMLDPPKVAVTVVVAMVSVVMVVVNGVAT